MTPLKLKNQARLSITPRKIGIAALGIAAVLLVVFVLAEILRFIGEPDLLLEEPAEDIALISVPVISVRGKAEKESRLTVNGRELRIDSEGNFEDQIELQPGVNELVFAVESRFGKISREVRYVVVR